MADAPAQETVSLLHILGAGGFGAVIGWYLYYANRHRKGEVQLTDLVTVVEVLGGAAIMALFPSGSTLFGAYGIGLFIGFFGYFLSLLIMIAVSRKFTVDWMLDGRRPRLPDDQELPEIGSRPFFRPVAPRAQPNAAGMDMGAGADTGTGTDTDTDTYTDDRRTTSGAG